MTRLEAWAARSGARIADQFRASRTKRDADAWLASELRKADPLLAGLLRSEVERAFRARLAELEEAAP